MLPTAENTLLQRLTMRGTSEAIDSARAPLTSALSQASWPSTAPGETIFLRRVKARGNPREIAARAAANAQRLADSAVDGWSSTAKDALAVRFRTDTSLIACLLRDLLLDTADKKWFWRRWQKTLRLPTDEAITTLLAEHPLHLPAVMTQLRTTETWQPFWQQIGNSQCAALLTVVAQATGWNDAVQRARANTTSPEEQSPAANRIVPLFDLTFLGCSSNDSRPLLVALLTLWQQMPAVLTLPHGSQQLRILARTISGEPDVTAAQPHNQRRGMKRHSGEAQKNATTPLTRRENMRAYKPLTLAYEELESASQTFTDTPLPRPELPPVSSRQPARHDSAKRNKSASSEHESAADTPQAGSSAHYETSTQQDREKSVLVASHTRGFITHQGGLLYLLNLLNLPSVRTQLPANLPGAGWRWLYDIGCALGCPPEGELLAFMAQECAMQDGAELAAQSAIGPVEQLLRLGAGRFGDEVWHANPWRIPARLIADSSHLEIHFRLNDANLAVRRVGLDITPGWLPWLGRVVSFHYGSGLEPETW